MFFILPSKLTCETTTKTCTGSPINNIEYDRNKTTAITLIKKGYDRLYYLRDAIQHFFIYQKNVTF